MRPAMSAALDRFLDNALTPQDQFRLACALLAGCLLFWAAFALAAFSLLHG